MNQQWSPPPPPQGDTRKQPVGWTNAPPAKDPPKWGPLVGFIVVVLVVGIILYMYGARV